MGEGTAVPDNHSAAAADVWRELAVVNQGFRESIRMIRGEFAPSVVFHGSWAKPDVRPGYPDQEALRHVGFPSVIWLCDPA
jgi:hypothetical protein